MYNTALIYSSYGDPLDALQKTTQQTEPLAESYLRVRMLLAPVNASDLIPITGAYRHRITLPAIAGYEGVGIVTHAPADFAHLLGQRVLPLRGQGTWQQVVDCPAALAVPVPVDIDDALAARAYINPLAALMMLKLHLPAGKHVMVTAAGSDCAGYLAQWAQQQGAASVAGIYRSAIHATRLTERGIIALSENDTQAIGLLARRADIVYDATGGALADLLLASMPATAQFVSYGLLSGALFRIQRHYPTVHWFHIRNYLADVSAADWQQLFAEVWTRLKVSEMSGVSLFDFKEWQQALTFYRQPGRVSKPMLSLD